MVDQASPLPPLQPVPVADSSTEKSTVVPPVEQSKRGPGLLWIAVALATAAAILGGGAYFLYIQQYKAPEKVSQSPPGLVRQEGKPNQGFNVSTPTPSATPTITSTDAVVDIQKDLSGTTLESGNASEFTADLQSL